MDIINTLLDVYALVYNREVTSSHMLPHVLCEHEIGAFAQKKNNSCTGSTLTEKTYEQ